MLLWKWKIHFVDDVSVHELALKTYKRPRFNTSYSFFMKYCLMNIVIYYDISKSKLGALVMSSMLNMTFVKCLCSLSSLQKSVPNWGLVPSTTLAGLVTGLS